MVLILAGRNPRTRRAQPIPGLREEEKLDSFNMPFYAPSIVELKDVINEEDSFDIDEIEHHEWGMGKGGLLARFSQAEIAGLAAKTFRAVSESMVYHHFGEGIIEDFFHPYEEIALEYQYEYKNVRSLTLLLTRK